jgi:hypothetical protein
VEGKSTKPTDSHPSHQQNNKFLADFQYLLVWAFPLASQDQTRRENAKSMNCAMLGIRLLMPLFKYNSNIDIG